MPSLVKLLSRNSASLRFAASASVVSAVAVSWIYVAWPKEPSVQLPIERKQPALPETTMLPDVKIKDILYSKEQLLQSKKSKLSIFSNSVASNSPIEDFKVEACLPRGTLLAVFDGHGGPECAMILKKHLPSYVAHQIAQPYASSTSRSDHIKFSLRQAFQQMDLDLINGVFETHLDSQKAKSPEPYSLFKLPFGSAVKRPTYQQTLANLKGAVAGACALVVYIEENDVYVACTGDSRAVMGRKMSYIPTGSRGILGLNKKPFFEKQVYQSVPLSVDQTPKNPKEYARLLDEHPGEEATVVSRGRILGGLMPSRAFGDARYKWSVPTLEAVLPHLYPSGRRGIPRGYKTPPYVTALPEVVHYQRDENDKFLVMATDGLWDELESDVVAKEIGSWMETTRSAKKSGDLISIQEFSNSLLSSASCVNPSTHLIKRAFGGPDLNADRINHVLSIPSPLSRRYRDDMTVNVILFNEEVNGELPIPAAKQASRVAHLSEWVASLSQFQAKL